MSRYFGIYGIILDRLFKILDHDNDGVLNKVEFILGMETLYSQATSLKSLIKFIFKFYDFDQNGKINIDDVKLILTHVFLSISDKEFGENFENINQIQTKINKIIDYSFQDKKEMDFNYFYYVIKNIYSDVFIFVLIFLLKKRPFSIETIFVYISEKNIYQNLLELSTETTKVESKIIKLPILNVKSVENFRHKNNLISQLLLRTDHKLHDLISKNNKIKESLIFNEGIFLKF